MTTLRQTLANLGAAKPNGKKVVEAHVAAIGDDTTLGFSVTGGTYVGEEQLIEARLEEWFGILKPVGAYQEWLAERAVAAGARIDHNRLEEASWRYRRSQRALLCWDVDRQAEAAQLAAGLARKPELVALKLGRTLQGADWILSHLRVLLEVLSTGTTEDNTSTDEGAVAGKSAPSPLNDDNRRLACDLLGLSAERRQGRTPLDLPAGSRGDLAAHQAAVISGQIATLEQRKSDSLIRLDTIDRTAAERGDGLDATIRQLRRGAAAAEKERRQMLDELKEFPREINRALLVAPKVSDVYGSQGVDPAVAARFEAAPVAEVPLPEPEQGTPVAEAGATEATEPAAPEPIASEAPAVDVIPAPPVVPPVGPRPMTARFAPEPHGNRHQRRALAAKAAHRS